MTGDEQFVSEYPWFVSIEAAGLGINYMSSLPNELIICGQRCVHYFSRTVLTYRYHLFAITHGNTSHFTASIKWSDGVRPLTFYYYDGMKNAPLLNEFLIPLTDAVKQHMIDRKYVISRIIDLANRQ
jgi:hypothetical protein